MKARWVIAAIIAIVSLVSYFRLNSVNPVTGENQRVALSPEQEVALGLQAAPEMAQQFGGLDPDRDKQRLVDEIGAEIVRNSDASRSPYEFEFHVLDDPNTVNAFALPGGQIFITDALLMRLKSRSQLAGVLGHEVGHVVGRHSAEQMAKAQLTQGLAGAAAVGTYDPENPSSAQTAAIAQMVGQIINMKYGREDELESDRLGVQFMADAKYDPRALIEVMKILEEASGGGGRQPEFLSTHPNPGNRVQEIEAAIKEEFPQGVPAGMRQ